MALTNIINGNIPDANVLMANFNYLLGLAFSGGNIKIDTYANLRIIAAAAPTTPFFCIATDADLYMLYCGNVARGDGGFVTLISFEEVS